MIYFKAEANEKVGGGHLNRCLAIAKECILSGGEAGFIFSESPDYVIDKVIKSGFRAFKIDPGKHLDKKAYLEFMAGGSAIVFDTDNPEFYSGNLIEGLKKEKITTACFTVSDRHKITTDILINPNIISYKHHYKTPPDTIKLLGPKYLIFREDFRDQLKRRTPRRQNGRNLVVIFGNADPNNLTGYFTDVIEIIGHRFTNVEFVIGPLNNRVEEIKSRAGRISSVNTTVVHNPPDIIQVYNRNSMAVTSGGMSMWEMALFRIPQMVVASSDREIEYTDYLAELKYIEKLANYSTLPEPSKIASRIEDLIMKGSLDKLNLENYSNALDPDGIKSTVSVLLTRSNTGGKLR